MSNITLKEVLNQKVREYEEQDGLINRRLARQVFDDLTAACKTEASAGQRVLFNKVIEFTGSRGGYADHQPRVIKRLCVWLHDEGLTYNMSLINGDYRITIRW